MQKVFHLSYLLLFACIQTNAALVGKDFSPATGCYRLTVTAWESMVAPIPAGYRNCHSDLVGYRVCLPNSRDVCALAEPRRRNHCSPGCLSDLLEYESVTVSTHRGHAPLWCPGRKIPFPPFERFGPSIDRPGPAPQLFLRPVG